MQSPRGAGLPRRRQKGCARCSVRRQPFISGGARGLIKLDDTRRTAVFPRPRGKPASEIFHYIERDRKPQTKAMPGLLRRKERIKELADNVV